MQQETFSAKHAPAHNVAKGPGDARPTALQVVEEEGLVGKLTGKTVLVTGCSSGLGIETARALYQTGARLFLTVRDLQKGQEVIEEIRTSHPQSQGSLELLELHLDSLQSVREAADAFLAKSSKLNILILNAGVMACPEGQTQDGFETHFGTNYLAHFLLFQLLKPALLSATTPDFNSRVVSVSSGGHAFSSVHFGDLDLKKQGYDKWAAYGQSKTACIWLANEIEQRFQSQGVHATSVHPGAIFTNLIRHMSEEDFKPFQDPELQRTFKTPAQGAATSVWAAVSPEWEGTGGKYLEDCREAKPKQDKWSGWAPHAFDAEGAKHLWALSLELLRS